eukprot:766480-Hanusia_phi.AAC.14
MTCRAAPHGDQHAPPAESPRAESCQTVLCARGKRPPCSCPWLRASSLGGNSVWRDRKPALDAPSKLDLGEASELLAHRPAGRALTGETRFRPPSARAVAGPDGVEQARELLGDVQLLQVADELLVDCRAAVGAGLQDGESPCRRAHALDLLTASNPDEPVCLRQLREGVGDAAISHSLLQAASRDREDRKCAPRGVSLDLVGRKLDLQEHKLCIRTEGRSEREGQRKGEGEQAKKEGYRLGRERRREA